MPRLRSLLLRSLQVAVGVIVVIGLCFAWWAYEHSQKQRRMDLKLERSVKLFKAEAYVRPYDLPQGQILVIDVPAADLNVPSIVERRRCFVWRDGENNTSSMSCDPAGAIAED